MFSGHGRSEVTERFLGLGRVPEGTSGRTSTPAAHSLVKVIHAHFQARILFLPLFLLSDVHQQV